MSKAAEFAVEMDADEIVKAIESKLAEALQRAADAQEDAAIWRRMLTSLLRGAPARASDRSDPWRGLKSQPALRCISTRTWAGQLDFASGYRPLPSSPRRLLGVAAAV
jgi:hypothetical protein